MCFPLWLSGLGRLAGMQAVQGSSFNSSVFFLLLFAFLSLDMFSFYSTAGPLFDLHEVLWYTLWVIRYDQMSLGMASNYP